MSIPPKPSSLVPSADQQRRQANRLLIRLQWLVILLLTIALVWLYIDQQRFENQIKERLQSNEHVVSRLNEMDDRLFAVSQQTLPQPSSAAGSQAQNQLDLLRIQIQAADRLLADDNDRAAIELLRGLHWQLAQESNEIAPALTIVIKQGLTEDIERLQAQSSQPSPWQLQNLAIQNIQEFLHSHERDKSHERLGNSDNTKLTRRQLVVHEVIMTLNLASQASNMRDQQQLASYLRQARKQLQTLIASSANSQTRAQAATNTKNPEKVATAVMDAPKNLLEVINWLDKLIANTPARSPLLTTQILDQPNNK
ncbi:hypothetical protein [Psychrobacter sp. DM8]|uniref:hypothetical protein n=1 Tax=Psychrobacter sp. DM8 TaxID=3440636 RepID=UPI003F4F4584